MRWFAIGVVGAAASSASAFSSGTARDALVAIAAASALLLAYLAARTEARLARSEHRLEEALERILELRYDVDQTAIAANSLHTLFDRPVRDRLLEEDYTTYVKPIDDAIARVRARVAALFGRSADGVDVRTQIEFDPGAIGGEDRRAESQAEREAGTVGEG